MEVELGMGQEQVDFDFHNNHLILDYNHKCNPLNFDCSNHSIHRMCNPLYDIIMLKKQEIIEY